MQKCGPDFSTQNIILIKGLDNLPYEEILSPKGSVV